MTNINKQHSITWPLGCSSKKVPLASAACNELSTRLWFSWKNVPGNGQLLLCVLLLVFATCQGRHDLSRAGHTTCLTDKTVWQGYITACHRQPCLFLFWWFPLWQGVLCASVPTLACVYVADVRALVCVLRMRSPVEHTVWGRP